MNFLLLIVFLLFSNFAYAQNQKIPESFKINGEYINPKCIEQLSTWISETDNIIIQSVVLETCQNSNLAFEGKNTFYKEKNKIGHRGNLDDPHDDFFYSYEATLPDNKHILSHGGSLSLYKITNKRLGFSVLNNDYREVHVLSKIAEIGFFHCFQNATVSENRLIVNRRIYYPENPRATACDDNKTEQIKIDLSGIQ